MFTGGTTGPPKAAAITHHGLLMAGMQIHAWLRAVSEPWRDVTLLLMPLFHAYGNIGVFSAALVARHTVAPVADPRDLDALVRTIETERPAFVCGVPTLFIALLDHAAVQAGRADFTSIKVCISGAAPLLMETKHRFEALTGGRIIEGYSLTEAVLAMVMSPVLGTHKPGSVGLPLPDVELRLINTATGAPIAQPLTPGEIWLRAPQLMVGYWNMPAVTADTLCDGWLRTGDVGEFDEDGYLTLLDRQKDVIKPSGFQVWPREVEERLAAHPAVQEVGVAGVPDRSQGEAVRAWVVLTPGRTVTEAELQTHCRETLAAYKVPRRIVFCRSLPKSTIGKVLRRELKRTVETSAR